MKKCPYCAEEIQDGAIKCRYCSSDLIKGSEEIELRKLIFNYHAKDSKGEYKDGTIEAKNQDDALNKLSAQGLFVISVEMVMHEAAEELLFKETKKIIEVKENEMKICPNCKEKIKKGALKCPHCRGDLLYQENPFTYGICVLGGIVGCVIFLFKSGIFEEGGLTVFTPAIILILIGYMLGGAIIGGIIGAIIDAVAK